MMFCFRYFVMQRRS